jgi:hypothetical protein
MIVHNVIMTVGLSCDVVGATLLGVEAVTLKNVRRLRDWLDERGHGFFRVINPQITLVDDVPPKSTRESLATTVTATAWLTGVLILGGAVSFGLYEVSRSVGASSLTTLPIWALVLASVGGVLLALTLGTLVISAAESLLNFLLRLIELLDRHTPTGGVGILGVVLLVVGRLRTRTLASVRDSGRNPWPLLLRQVRPVTATSSGWRRHSTAMSPRSVTIREKRSYP